MTDPFTDVADELMMRSTDLGDAAVAPPPPSSGGAKTKKHVCPYCGAVTAVVEKPTGPCPKCNMEDTPATRAATKARIGPWYVLQTRNPSAPGMKWATLLSLVSKGQVTPRSVVRGPTTHQLWKFAAHVKGLSREFNLCYSCGGEIDRTANQCPHCDRLQEPPVNPDALLESRELARTPVQREIKLPAAQSTEMVVASPRAADDNRGRTPDDGILSAKELAAAFQLDFRPDAPSPSVPMPAPHAPRRKRRPVLTLLALAVIGGGVLLYFKPEYREQALEWSKSKYEWARTSLATKPVDNTPMLWETPPTKASDTMPPVLPSPEPTTAPEAVEPATPVVEDTNPAVDSEPPAPTVTNPPPPVVVEAPNPPPAVESDREPAVKPTATAKMTLTEQIEELLKTEVPTSHRAQEELSRRLYYAAMDAERLQDIQLAIRCYERILELDRDVQPIDTRKRLEFVKDLAPKG